VAPHYEDFLNNTRYLINTLYFIIPKLWKRRGRGKYHAHSIDGYILPTLFYSSMGEKVRVREIENEEEI